jgi:hypothetical protein
MNFRSGLMDSPDLVYFGEMYRTMLKKSMF